MLLKRIRHLDPLQRHRILWMRESCKECSKNITFALCGFGVVIAMKGHSATTTRQYQGVEEMGKSLKKD